MNIKKKIFFGSLISFGGIALIVSLLYFYGFSLSIPEYDNQYFTSEFIYKYASAENTFEHFVSAITTGDISYYQEVIGKIMSKEEIDMFKLYSGKKPKITKIVQGKKLAYIITDNNWGEYFEQVKGRWVFTPEDFGVLVRDIFR